MRSKPTNASLKYFNPDAYIVSWAPFKFKSPELGIGWMFRRNRLYLNTGLSFWFGQKNLRYDVGRYSDNHDPMGTSTEPYPGYGQSMPYDYYYISESFSGKIAYYNLDWHLALGLNLGSHFAFFLGYQRNFLLYHSVDGGFIKRVNVITQINPFYSTNSSSWMEKYENNSIKDVYGQVVNGIHYIVLGFNYTHSTHSRSLSYELQGSFPTGDQDHANHIYIRLKFSCALIKQKKTEPDTK
ncbi:MAG: hypothetical protein JNK73_07420 [Bacteroidia bacterium]|nr:hypothetical protein [Bacteroidia bacterium]